MIPRDGRVCSGVRVPVDVLVSELIGTAVLVAVGVSFVILDFGAGSPVPVWLPDPAVRRAVTGFLFGSTGALIALSPVGRISGAHINPVVTLAFWMRGNLGTGHAAATMAAQLAGACLGAAPLLLWGGMGASVSFGATVPGQGFGAPMAAAGETAATFALVVLLFLFLGHDRLRRFTPLLFPFLYAFMVAVEAPLSGTSTNPARTLGPAVVAGAWRGWWVYWAGPVLGAVLGTLAYRTRWLKVLELEVAKIYHFEHDPHGLFQRRRPVTGDLPPQAGGA